MNEATVTTDSFSLSLDGTEVTGDITFNSAKTIATFTPAEPLLNDTTYEAKVTTSIKDLAGNRLDSELTWSFTTTAAPAPDKVVLSVDAPDTAKVGSTFTVKINVTEVTDLAGYDVYIAYNDAVIKGKSATAGKIGTTNLPLDGATIVTGGVDPNNPQTCFRVFGHFPASSTPNSVSGTGHLAIVTFEVIGSASQTSNVDINLGNNMPTVIIDSVSDPIEMDDPLNDTVIITAS